MKLALLARYATHRVDTTLHPRRARALIPESAISFSPAAPGTLAYRESALVDEFSASLASLARIWLAINTRAVEGGSV
jgi:hypothetical protein